MKVLKNADFTFVFIVFILIVIGLINYQKYNGELIYVRSPLDNKEHLVRNVRDKQEAADLMAKIKLNIKKLCDYLQTKHSDDERIHRLIKRYNADKLMESESSSKNTSYSINKGEKVVLCMRSKDVMKKLVDENIMMFVTLHEVAHIMTKSKGHTKEFWDNFRFLLKQAIKIGIYHHVDFNSTPVEYCGVEITDTPLK